MKRALNALILLYPKAWRDRYQNEFEAMLEDVPLTWRTVVDVLGGALKMQLKLWSPWKLVAACGVVGVLAAGAYTMTIPRRYISQAVLRFHQDGPPSEVDEELSEFAQAVLSTSSLTGLVTEEDLYKKERASLPLEDILSRMLREDIRIIPISARDGGTGEFAIAFAAANASDAQRVARRLTSFFMDKSRVPPDEKPRQVVELLDPPDLPASPANPRLSKNMIMGLMAGLIAGALFALFNGLKVWKLAAALGIAGLGLGAVAGYLVPVRYSSVAVIRYQDGIEMNQLVQTITSPASLDSIIQEFGLYPNDPDAQRKVRQSLHFRPIQRLRNGVGAMWIQFDDRDRFIARAITNEVVSQLNNAAAKNVRRLDPPSLPLQPTSPNRPVIAGMGLFVGLLSAIGLGSFRNFRSPSAV